MGLFNWFTNLAFKRPDRADYRCEQCGKRTDPQIENRVSGKFVCHDCFNETLREEGLR